MLPSVLIAGAHRRAPQWRQAWRGALAAAGLALAFAMGAPLPAAAADPPQANDGAQVLQSFERDKPSAEPADATDQTRRWVMFALGSPLLILLLITGGLGIAMGVYGKQVYLAHMICAGLSITLAIVHAIVGIVWFRPF
jgi:hypothetical protein